MSKRPTIKGPYPAACFTEQSLKCFVESCKVLPTHYHPYSIALHKRALYQYGGRPVIYGSEDILGKLLQPNEAGYETDKEIYKNGLPIDHQYLWARYQPIPNEDGFVVDWTHEREWRCRIHIYHDVELGTTPNEGIPILLPAIYDYSREKWIHYLPKIIVAKTSEKQIIEETIRTNRPEWVAQCQDKYLQNYFKALPQARVINLDTETCELEWQVLEKTQLTN